MDKEALMAALAAALKKSADFYKSVADDQFLQKPAGKWSVAQNVQHLIQSAMPVNLAFNLPKPLLGLFGKKNQPSRSPEEIVSLYQSKLQTGAKASLPFQPMDFLPLAPREKLLKNYETAYLNMCRNIEKWTEEELDTYCLPHPIIGRISMREMTYFTIYHLGHHEKVLIQRFA